MTIKTATRATRASAVYHNPMRRTPSRQRDRPRVTVACVADRYAGHDERIVEFSFADGLGGLVSFRTMHDGTHVVEVYRTDKGIEVVR